MEDIKSDFYNHRISKKETINRLISTIESLEDEDYESGNEEVYNYRDAIDAQVEAVKVFRKLHLISDEIFKVLENIIVSQRELIIKLTALKVVAELFPTKYEGLLKWLSETNEGFKILINDCWPEDHYYTLVVAEIYDIIMWSNNENLRELQKIIEKKTSSITQQYVLEGVDPQEARILTIFELEFLKLPKVDKDIDIHKCGYDCGYKINDMGHVTEVFFNLGESETYIPQKINLLRSLEKLILIGRRIKIIPNSVGKLKKLKELNLGFNSIGNLTQPKYFPESLEVLSLRDNRIKSIPESILNLRNLKVLELCTNQIERLPESFKNASNVIHLDLADNKIFHIPESLKELKSATLIDLRANPARKLPEYFDTEEWRSKIKVSPAPKDLKFLIPECISKLGLNSLAVKLIFEIIDLYKINLQSRESGHRGLIAGILYYACKIKNSRINGKEITQKDISDLVEVPESILRSSYNELLKNHNLINL